MKNVLNNGKWVNTDIFFNTKNISIHITGYIVATYLSFFITYLAKNKEPMLFQVKEIILTIILSYILVLIVKKLIIPKNNKVISIYPLKLKKVIFGIYIYEYIKYLLLGSAFILPDVILGETNFLSYCLLMLSSLLAINIGIIVIPHNLKKYSLLSNLFVNLSILFIFSSALIHLTFSSFWNFFWILFVLIVVNIITFFVLYKDKNELFISNIFKYSYTVTQTKKSILKERVIKVFDKYLFRHKYLYKRELENILLNKMFELNLIRSFILMISTIIFLKGHEYNSILFFDLTILLSSVNYFASSAYYIENSICTLRDIVPLDELELFNAKVIINTFIWMLIFSPYIMIILFNVKITFILNVLFILTSLFLWSHVALFVDYLLNVDKNERKKNIYTRFIVVIISIMYLTILKDSLFIFDYGSQIEILVCSILNIVVLFLLRRAFIARVSKCYKKF